MESTKRNSKDFFSRNNLDNMNHSFDNIQFFIHEKWMRLFMEGEDPDVEHCVVHET